MSIQRGADELIMDVRGGRDPRYYCLPPFHGAGDREARHSGPFYLVSHGQVVGTFNDWFEAKASVSGFPDNSHRKYNSVEECNNAWQVFVATPVRPCRPHNTSQTTTGHPTPPRCMVKEDKPESGVDLNRLYTPSASRSPPASPINFVIRGYCLQQCVSERTRDRYLEMQGRGEEPDLLLTHSLRAASRFALDEALNL
ncbi:hypothetical protein K438DRAFT_1967634 [Mycena galopus ATCC 62051]|nr:hypothetical protein K438DRAFT_1967634 [Mycena galopus ATCC 62051]